MHSWRLKVQYDEIFLAGKKSTYNSITSPFDFFFFELICLRTRIFNDVYWARMFYNWMQKGRSKNLLDFINCLEIKQTLPRNVVLFNVIFRYRTCCRLNKEREKKDVMTNRLRTDHNLLLRAEISHWATHNVVKRWVICTLPLLVSCLQFFSLPSPWLTACCYFQFFSKNN